MFFWGVFCLSSYPVFLRHCRHPATSVVARVGTVSPASSGGVVVQPRLQVLGGPAAAKCLAWKSLHKKVGGHSGVTRMYQEVKQN